MPNANPISTSDPGDSFPELHIPADLAGKTLCISTHTEQDAAGWELDLVHSLTLDGEPLDFYADPDINQKQIDLCSELNGHRLALVSKAVRGRDGGDPPPPLVTFTVTYSCEDGTVIGSFSCQSDHSNPAVFFVKIAIRVG